MLMIVPSAGGRAELTGVGQRQGTIRRLKKTARISISSLHETFYGFAEDLTPDDSRTINRLVHRSGLRNWVDVLSKALDCRKHWECTYGLGLRTFVQDGARTRTLELAPRAEMAI